MRYLGVAACLQVLGTACSQQPFYKSSTFRNAIIQPAQINGSLQLVCRFDVRSRGDFPDGRLRDYDLFASDDSQNWGAPIQSGSLPNNASPQKIALAQPVTARYLKIVWQSEQTDKGLGSLAEATIIPSS